MITWIILPVLLLFHNSGILPPRKQQAHQLLASKSNEFGTSEFWNLCSEIIQHQDVVLEILREHQDDDLNFINTRDTTMGDGYTVLHHASMQGAFDVVQYCLEDGNADPNLKTFTYESTPLKWAANRGYDDIVKLLLEFGADTSQRDTFGYTPLQYACLGGFSNVVSSFLNLDHESTINDDDYDQLIQDIIKLINVVSDGTSDDINCIDETGFTPLHVACSLGRVDLVEVLLELGASADVPNQEGRTPLFFAVSCGHNSIVKLLADWGGYFHVCTNQVKTSYHIATPGWTLLHEASEKNTISCAELLLKKGEVDVNVCDIGKETPLMIAVQNGNYELAKLLVTHYGANVNLADDWNTTPLHTACRLQRKSIVLFLLDNGADVNAQNNYNETPLHQSCWVGHAAISKMLVDNGGEIHAKNKDGQTPLDYARQRGHATPIVHSVV